MIEHEFLDYVAPYAVGALSEPEKSRMEQHLREGCEICEPELRMYQETANRLAFGVAHKPLPPGLKEKIRSRVEQETARSTPIRWGLVVRFAAVIALVLFGGSILWYQSEELRQQDKEIAEMQQRLRQQREEIVWLRDPSVQLALLTGLAPAPEAKGKMLWNPSVSRGILYASTLPPLGPDKSYQLWVIGSKGPVSAGVFSPDPQGSVVFTISHVQIKEGALQFAVTIEPRGGVPQPTGSMVLAGKPL